MNKKLIFLLAICCYKAAASSQQIGGPFGIGSSNSQIMSPQDSSSIDGVLQDDPSQNLPMTDSVGQQIPSIIPEHKNPYFPASSLQLPIRTNDGSGSRHNLLQYPMNNQVNNQPEQNYLQGTQGNSDTRLMLPQGGYASNNSMNNSFAPRYSFGKPHSFNAPMNSSLINNPIPIAAAVQSYSESSFINNPLMTGNQSSGNYDLFATGANNSPLFKESLKKRKKHSRYSKNYAPVKSLNNFTNHAGKLSKDDTVSQPSVVSQYSLNKEQGFSKLNDFRTQACTDLTQNTPPQSPYHYDKASSSSLIHKNSVLSHELQGAQPQENAFLDTNDKVASWLKQLHQASRMVNDDTVSTSYQGPLSVGQLLYLKSLGLTDFLPEVVAHNSHRYLNSFEKFAAIKEAYKNDKYAGEIKRSLGGSYVAYCSAFMQSSPAAQKTLLLKFENSRMQNLNGLK